LSFFNFSNAITACYFADRDLRILKVNDNFRSFFPVLGDVSNVLLLHVLKQLGVDESAIDSFQQQLADSRGHDIVRGRAMPTLGNIIVWRSLYEDADGRLHADAVRAGMRFECLGPGLRVNLPEGPWTDITAHLLEQVQSPLARQFQIALGIECRRMYDIDLRRFRGPKPIHPPQSLSHAFKCRKVADHVIRVQIDADLTRRYVAAREDRIRSAGAGIGVRLLRACASAATSSKRCGWRGTTTVRTEFGVRVAFKSAPTKFGP
jgi:hypothetical protein